MMSSFSKTHAAALSMEGLNHEHFLVIAHEAVLKLGSTPAYLSAHHIVYYTPVRYNGTTEAITININDTEASITSKAMDSRLFDLGKGKKNIAAFVAAFDELKAALSAEELTTKYEQLLPQLSADDPDQYSRYIGGSSSVKDFLGIFIPTKDFFITPILIDINIAVFIVMCIAGVNFFMPATADLLNWGANFRANTINGQWWRLLTSMFLHGGILHLLMNMYALLYIGMLLEPLLDRSRYLAAYLLSGICGGLLSVTMHSLTVAVGASGAIFGMYGVFLALLTTNFIEKNARKAILQSILIFVGLNLANGMKEGIDNAAHIGGLISGLLIGYAYVPGLRKIDAEPEAPKLIIALLSVLVVGLGIAACQLLPDPYTDYQKKIEAFAQNEERALSVYKLPHDTTPIDTFLSRFNSGLADWRKNYALATEMLALDLPESIQKRNKILQEYAFVRAESYILLYKQFKDTSFSYENRINEENEKVQNLLSQLNGK